MVRIDEKSLLYLPFCPAHMENELLFFMSAINV